MKDHTILTLMRVGPFVPLLFRQAAASDGAHHSDYRSALKGRLVSRTADFAESRHDPARYTLSMTIILLVSIAKK